MQSLGRIPTLKQNESKSCSKPAPLHSIACCTRSVSLEQSPITRRRSTEFVRSGSLPPPTRTSKRPSSATIQEEEEPEEDVRGTSGRQAPSSLKRSESERRQRASATADFDEVDYPRKLRSNSFGTTS